MEPINMLSDANFDLNNIDGLCIINWIMGPSEVITYDINRSRKGRGVFEQTWLFVFGEVLYCPDGSLGILLFCNSPIPCVDYQIA